MTIAIAVLCVLVLVSLATRWFFNWLSPRVDGRRRVRDDEYFFNQCKSGMMTRYRWISRHLPAAPRCKFCLAPFRGLGRIGGIKPSRKNPNFCMGCFEMAPLGGHDMEIGVLFADIRGFTNWSERATPQAVEHTLNAFYKVTTDALVRRDAIVDKLIGDEVMGLFLTVFPSLGGRTCEIMVDCAESILRELESSGDGKLPVGIGLHFGMARVGNIGAGDMKDFTAVGDVVNTAARLQSCADAGQIVMSDTVYERVADRYPNAVETTFTVKGKAEPLAARVVPARLVV